MNRKGVEPFLVILAIVLVLFFIVVYGVGGIQIPGFGPAVGPYVPGAGGTMKTSVYSATIGLIGVVKENYESIELGDFSVGYAISEQVAAQDFRIEIKKGLLADVSKTYTFSGAEATSARLTFSVADTNAYGGLRVLLNGLLIRTINAPGDYTIDMPDLSSGTNTLILEAESSGLKFWAPTVYVITNLNLTVSAWGEQRKTISFTLTDEEVEGWTTGRLIFWLDATKTRGEGNIIAEINGNTIYEAVPTLTVQRDFSRLESGVVPGENVITFRTQKNSTYALKNVELIVFYYSTKDATTIGKNFTMSSSARSLLRNGTGEITFEIEEVLVDRGITLWLNDMSWEFESLEANETYTAAFTDSDALATNRLRFVTGGKYKIGDVTVSVSGTTGVAATNVTTTAERPWWETIFASR